VSPEPDAFDRHRLLADLLAHGRSEDDPRVARALADDPSLRAELRELRAIAGQLEDGGNEFRSELKRAMTTVTDDDVDMARHAIERFHGRSRRRQNKVWGLLLAAAAAVMLAVTWWPDPEDEIPQTALGTAHEIDMRPAGNVDPATIELFTWALPGDSRVLVQIYCGFGDEELNELPVASYRGRARQYRPTPAELEHIRSANLVYWTVSTVTQPRSWDAEVQLR